MKSYDYQYYRESADYILKHIPRKPEIAVVLGSCLGPLADDVEQKIEIPYEDIPNFLVSTVESHAGKLIFGWIGGKYVVFLSGRFHYYEGYDFEQLTSPIRVLNLLDVKVAILTNAAGGINKDYKPGDIMIFKDHIKLMGASPLRGPNLEEFGPRFFDISKMYTPELRHVAMSCAENLGQKATTREGVYYYATGPQFESPAEVRAMGILGGDAVGMSTVTESLTATHCGMKLLAISLISNMAAGVVPGKVTEEEVDQVAEDTAARFRELIKEILKEMKV
jgi:purine-nucleoside phosphorylase